MNEPGSYSETPSWDTRMRSKYGPYCYEKRNIWKFRLPHRYTWFTAIEREISGRRKIKGFSSLTWNEIRTQFESGKFPSWVDKKKMAEQRLRYL